MTNDRERFERLLGSVADDTPADWQDEPGRLTEPEAEEIASLRELLRIAEFNRGLQRTPDGADAVMRSEWGGLLLLERIGTGRHSEVWRAWDPALRREVALKWMRAGALSSAAIEAAVLDEARAAARVSHPHVVVVHGVARHDDRVGLWMEFVRGASLDRIVRQSGPLAPSEVAVLGAELASALDAVHAAGVLHRDVKPANVVRDSSGRWVLVDFGLGWAGEAHEGHARPSSGTPMYMAPEVFRGEAPTAASDLYSLGLLLWFALTGRDAFPARTLEERARMAAEGTVPAIREVRSDAPPGLAATIERAIARDPARRFANGAAFADALRAPGPETRRAWVGLRSVLILAGIAVGLFVVLFGWQRVERARQTRVQAAGEKPVPAPAADAYAVEATFLRRTDESSERLQNGGRIAPGDRLSLELRVTRPAWVYVLNEDDRGEHYLLFPQPSFDVVNPLPADSQLILPGTIGGRENAWKVTSRGGREHLLVVVSPEPLADLEGELSRLPAPRAGRPIAYTAVQTETVDRLRSMGGLEPVAPGASGGTRSTSAFDRFRSLANRESGMRGVWVRQVVLENPVR